MWRVEWTDAAEKNFGKLNRAIQKKIIRYLSEKIETAEDPKRFGKGLKSNLKGLWRYRIEDYRVICRIEEESVIVLVIKIAHRKDVYDE